MDITLKDLLKIDNRFEKSVNLTLDLNDASKLSSYIPTRSSMNILEAYLQGILVSSDIRANILVGPYGKGKSHLLLVLLALLSKRSSKEMSALKKKMAKVSPEIEETLLAIESKGKFLPVIVNPSQGNLHSAFYKALIKAMSDNGISDIVPDSFYSEALKQINVWKSSYPEAYKKFIASVKNAEALIDELSEYNENALNEFMQVYPSITAGSVFNPVVDDDVISVYRSVNRKLCSTHDYSGIYIVFDEFSKYVEGHTYGDFAEDMKTLQDMCELALASKEEQLHITCVAHKSIKSYSNSLSKEILNLFEGVSGRLKEVLFVVSSKNNYELIENAIGKTPIFLDYIKQDSHYKEITRASYSSKVFSTLFTEGDFKKIVAAGCYPLTPICSMLLLELCEKVAQNERTLFTFITGKDQYCLSKIINRRKPSFVGVDAVYDYFSILFKDDLGKIHQEWLKAEYALDRVDNLVAKRIIKALAVIKMINKDEICGNDEILRLAIGLAEPEYEKGKKLLLEAGLFTFKNLTKTYEFKNNIGIDIDAVIADCQKKYYAKADTIDILNEVNENKCILPKKHNYENKITRFFNVYFLQANQFLALNDLSFIQQQNEPDGYVFLIIPGSATRKEVEEHLKKFKNVLILFPQNKLDSSDKPRRLLAIRKLKNSPEFVENNAVIVKELNILEREAIEEINTWINETYLLADTCYICGEHHKVGAHGLNREVSDVCDANYSLTPVINNELINRHHISSQISRAREILLNAILMDEDLSKYNDATSSEATIFRAVFKGNCATKAFKKVDSEINGFIASSVGERKEFKKLITKLTSSPYGMRKGVLPLILLDRMQKLSGTPIIYLANKEVVLNAETICNIVNNPEGYSLFTEEKTAEKDKYLANLESLFIDYSTYCKDIDKKNKINRVSCLIQSWYRSMPQISVTFSERDSNSQDINAIIAFRKLFTSFYLNPREVIFEEIPKLVGANTFNDAFVSVTRIKKETEEHIHIIKKQAAAIIRETMGIDSKSNLKVSIDEWYSELPTVVKNSMFDGSAANVMRLFTASQLASDEEQIANAFSKAVVNTYIEDWNDGKLQFFKDELVKTVATIRNAQEIKETSHKVSFITDEGAKEDCFINYNPSDLSTSGTFLKNAISDALEEYGDAIDNNEKVGILLEIVKGLIK